METGLNFKIEIFAILSNLKKPEISNSNEFKGYKFLSRHHIYTFQPQFLTLVSILRSHEYYLNKRRIIALRYRTIV